MVFGQIMQRFMEQAPIPVMARILLERVLDSERIDACFERASDKQYTRELMFSSVFEIMVLVVTKVFPSVNAAYKAKKTDIGVSIASLYNKLNGIEIDVSSALVEDTANELGKIITELGGECAPLLPGFRVKMLDGNCIEATEHRLEVLRHTAAGALPGKSLVVYDPALEMAVNIIPCEDGHAQERSLLSQVIQTIDNNDVFIMDRNFCVRHFMLDIHNRGAFFVVRHHKQFNIEARGEKKYVGKTETGKIHEQWIDIADGDKKYKWRSITVDLHKETRDGDDKITILTNLPKSKASAKLIAKLYRKRWTIETMFQELESYFNSEINALGYPKAALFGFCVAQMAYNVLAVLKAALRSVHGEKVIADDVSGYYIAGELERTHVGMNVAILDEEWTVFQTMKLNVFIEELIKIAKNVDLIKYKKNRRGPKKPAPPRESLKNKPHVSTAKLLLK
jgi:hypothetical protein